MAEEKITRHISVAMFEIFYLLAYICSYYMINDSKKQFRCYPYIQIICLLDFVTNNWDLALIFGKYAKNNENKQFLFWEIVFRN